MIKLFLKKVLPLRVINLIGTHIHLIKESNNKKKNQKKLIEIVTEKEVGNKPVCIEIGSATPRNNWITIDLIHEADVCLDLSSGIPLNDETVDIVYSSHLLEHFHYHELLAILKELKRILKNGGELSICVPDAKIFMDAYQRNDEKLKSYLDNTKHFEHQVTRIDLINYIAYMGSVHKYMFEMENLISILKYVGFKEVYKREFQIGLDLEVRKDESIYALAIK